jgi:hypothetical protein
MRQPLLSRTVLLCAFISSLAAGGCSTVVPNFDIPVTEAGAPTVKSISNRVKCELADLVQKPGAIRDLLLISDMQVALQLNLTVNDTGGVSPSLAYINAPSFAFGVGATLSQSREQNFTQKYYYSLRSLQLEANFVRKRGFDLAACGPTDTNLAGELGLRRTVELAFTSQHVAQDTALSDGGMFGGYVNFVVTKNVNAGPTWTLTHFVGPGSNLGTFSEVNTDKLTFAFAQGGQAGTSFAAASARGRADRLLDQINLNQLSTQLGTFRQLR